MFLLVICVFAAIALIETAPLVKARQVKKLILYLCIFLPAFILTLLLSLGVKLSTPAKPMGDFIDAIAKIFSS
ncbi:hypothetical protein DFR58_11959 [Anaerobacterium chartisolvens]|uniref:Stage III sporulation protein AF n=1 Tax=Anaerobacterium chartisolvens TaxID=1297424 RepID=A0A369AUE3_9FIRM|nr:hypothetical protein [Anaerobacterium chartisolvens]RCX13002.1 hypothetical protein DFR58_11959 [Anaerobacterium chartisolvens]